MCFCQWELVIIVAVLKIINAFIHNLVEPF